MDNRLLLVKSVTLLYRESLLPTKQDNSSELIRQVLENIKVSEINLSINKERDILIALKQTVLEMCENPIDHEYEKSELLQRLKMNCFGDEGLYDNFSQAIEPDMTDSSLKRSVVNIRKSISNHFKEQQVDEVLMRSAGEFRHHRDKIKNVSQWISELVGKLEPFQLNKDTKDPAIIGDVDTSNLKDVANVFTSIKDAASGASLLKTGLIGINNMLDGGFRRGETWVIGALQHNYKTGFSLTIFKQIALYNTPVMLDVTKKPLLLRISAEDSLALNFQFLYQSLRENESGEEVDLSGITEEEMAEYVKTKLAINGYHTRFIHVNPSLWTYKSICNKIIELESEGYEIHCCMIDYLLKIPTTGCDQGPSGQDVINMYERLRNFFAARGILFITPHQLSTDAKMLIRDGRQDFVKQLPGMGFYSRSKQIDQIVDGEIFIHIEKLNDEAYLSIQRGKHRKVTQTPSEYLYAVYKFNPVGGIPDDLTKFNTARKKVGGKMIGEVEGEIDPAWDNF